MRTATQNDDRRTEEEKTEMAEWFARNRTLEAEGDDRTLVYEDDDCVIIADERGVELAEWVDTLNADHDRLRESMRAVADGKMGKQEAHEIFSTTHPVVFGKIDGEEA